MEPEWAGGCRDLEGEQQNCGTPGQTLLTKYSSIRDCSVSRRISTSPLWVTLKAGRLYGSCCCCSRSARPCEAGQPSSSGWRGWEKCSTQNPGCFPVWSLCPGLSLLYSAASAFPRLLSGFSTSHSYLQLKFGSSRKSFGTSPLYTSQTVPHPPHPAASMWWLIGAGSGSHPGKK